MIRPRSARLGGIDVETDPVGTSFGVVRQTLCVTALVGDLVISRVGLAESADELGEEGEGRVGHGGGGHGRWRERTGKGIRVCKI